MDTPKRTEEKSFEKNINIQQKPVKLPEIKSEVNLKSTTTPFNKNESPLNNKSSHPIEPVRDVGMHVEEAVIMKDTKGIKEELNRNLVKEEKRDDYVVNSNEGNIIEKVRLLENVFSKTSSECDTQEDSEEINSIKSFTKININFRSSKLTKMKVLLSRMKAIQKLQKSEKNIKEPLPDIVVDSSSNKNSLVAQSKIQDGNKINKTENHINHLEEQGKRLENLNSNNNPLVYDNPKKKNNYHVSKHFSNFYGTKHIELWDSEEDSDLLNKQIDFMKSSQPFEKHKTIQKDEYDEDYDTGKLKKVKKPKEQFNHNVFQKHHDYLAYENKKSEY